MAANQLSLEAEFSRYLPHLSKMSEQLKQTSQQIETAVMDVCGSFQGIAERAMATVSRGKSFLRDGDPGNNSQPSFESLIQQCSQTLVHVLNTTKESGEVSSRAIERIKLMDAASQKISSAIRELEAISSGNKIMALNARIEAAHAGEIGAGFAVVAVEVAEQTERSQKVTDRVKDMVSELRNLAGSTLQDLQQMNLRDLAQVEECRRDVDEALYGLQSAHAEMKNMMTQMSRDGELLVADIGSAVRGMQFQDRVSQRIAHVVHDLETLKSRLSNCPVNSNNNEIANNDGFSSYTMLEEREVAGIADEEQGAGEVVLF